MIVGDEAPGLAWVTLHYDMGIILHLCLTLTSKWVAGALVVGREAAVWGYRGYIFHSARGEDRGRGQTRGVRLLWRDPPLMVFRDITNRGKTANLLPGADILVLVVWRRHSRYIWWSDTVWELGTGTWQLVARPSEWWVSKLPVLDFLNFTFQLNLHKNVTKWPRVIVMFLSKRA